MYNMNNNIPSLLSLQQAAEILDVHPVTLVRWEKEGKISLVHLGPRSIRITQDEVTRFIQSTIKPERA